MCCNHRGLQNTVAALWCTKRSEIQNELMAILRQLSRSKLAQSRATRTNAFRPSALLKQAASRERGRFLAHQCEKAPTRHPLPSGRTRHSARERLSSNGCALDWGPQIQMRSLPVETPVPPSLWWPQSLRSDHGSSGFRSRPFESR